MSEVRKPTPARTGPDLTAALEGRAARAERRAQVLARVIRAGVQVGSEIALDQVLVRIVEAGCDLTGARYGALGVLDASGTELAEFVTVGISPDERGRLGDLPRGRGILGALIRDAVSLRLDTIGEDPRSVGFPPGHPPMRSFLGVPILVREAPFGNLYLTEKADGPFTEQDEEAVTLLADQAAVVVEHARMVEASRRWSQQLEALADVSSAFTHEIDVDSLLKVIAGQLLGVVDAKLVLIELLEPGDQLRAAAVAGGRAERVVVGTIAPVGSKAGRVLSRRRSERVDAALDDPEIDPHGAAAKLSMRSGMWVPLVARGQVLGIITIADKRGADTRFRDEDLRVAEALAQRAAEAIDQSRRVSRHTVQAMIEAQEAERTRLSRELHDQTGQALTAILLGLSAFNTTDEPARLQVAAVKDLVKGALEEVRRIAVELRPPSLDDFGLVAALERLVQTTTTHELRVELVAVVTDGARLAPAIETATYRIVQEAITNAVKHANARTISVSVIEHDGHLVSLIEDDGDGFDAAEVSESRLGLKGMRERADILSGTITIHSSRTGGTAIRARIPMDRPEQERPPAR